MWRASRPRWCVRVCVLSSSGLLRLSRGFLFGSLAQLRRRVPLPGPLYSGLPQLSPSLSPGCSTASLLLSLLRRWVRSTSGAAILCLALVPTSGVYPYSIPSVCRLSHRPSPNENPAFPWHWRVRSGLLASWSLLRTAKLFSGVDSFIGNGRFTPSPLTHSSDRQLPVLFTLQQTFNLSVSYLS